MIPGIVVLMPGGNTLVAVAIAVVIGAVLFLWGLKSRRDSLAATQISGSSIANIGIGAVQVRGKATGGQHLTSPISGVFCYYYKLQVEKWVKQGDQVTWQAYKNETGQQNFYLDDGSGRVLVDLQAVEFDLPATLQAEIGINSAHYCKVDPSAGIARLGENQLHAALIAGWGQARATAQSVGGAAGKAADKVLATGDKMAEWGMAMNIGGVEVNPGLVGESFRIRETCLLADHEYSAIGTCDQNINAKDAQDGKIVHRGAATKTFLISDKTGQQLEKKLQLQAIVFMVVGALLVAGAVVFALIRR